MNTTALKRFAQEARRKLLMQVGARLELVLNTDSAELREKAQSLRRLREEISASSKQQVVDKVAYTWFNRFIALRFMDVKDYQPLGLRMVTPREGYTLPEVLHEAKQGHIPEELPVNRRHIQDLLDGRIPAANAQNEAYKELLIGACNHLHQVFPFMFERINDYTELLLPDDLTSGFSIVHDIREGMQAADCAEVEIIGWLYQFYISERKDEVIASKEKVKKEDIPAATQLFTPRWIVEYMVQNTLGKLWLQNRPHSKLRQHMPYYIENQATQYEDFLKLKSVEEMSLLDQAAGSGHILVYGFELLTRIYEEEGYNTGEIPALILKNNLFGFEIDGRAAQLASFTLMMKARHYDRRAFYKNLVPNIVCFVDFRLKNDELSDLFSAKGLLLSENLAQDLDNMRQASHFGSLIIPKTPIAELERMQEKLSHDKAQDAFISYKIQKLTEALKQLSALGRKYHCVVDNPPYMGGGNMNKELGDFVKKHYPDSKSDLMACFMESGLSILYSNGFMGMINQHSWMFLSSYEALRKKLIENVQIDTLLHLGPRTFPEIGGEVVQNASFTIENVKPYKKGAYIRLVDDDRSELKRTKTIQAIQNPNCGWFYTANQHDFEKIPGSPIGYWLSKESIGSFESTKISDFYIVRNGISTGDNIKYLKLWHEVLKNNTYWKPCNKGGLFRKWYGNNEFVVYWKDNGIDIRTSLDDKGRIKARLGGLEYSFSEGIEMSRITSGKSAFRFSIEGFIYESSTNDIFKKHANQDLQNILGYLNTKIVDGFLKLMNPTINIMPEDIRKLPIISNIEELGISKIVEENILISRKDWDSLETSCDFQQNELIKQANPRIKDAYKSYQKHWSDNFYELHKNEEELNRQFIEIYGLQEELTPDVPLEDITILQQELDRAALARLNKKLKRDPETHLVTNYDEIELPFIASEVMAQFVSYAVGCMFGRYSLDKEGLILANQGETVADYVKKVAGDWWTVDGNGNWVFNQEIYDDEHRKKLQGVADMAASHGTDQTYIHFAAGNAQGRIVWPDESDQKGSSERTEQHSRGSGEGNQGVYPFSDDSQRIPGRTGDTTDATQGTGNDETRADNTPYGVHRKPGQANQQPDQQTPLTTTHHPPPTNHHPPITFMPDDDNIIPILDEEWFEDDIVNRFHQFLKVAFGEEHFSKNLAFLEDSLGKDIRKYFLKDFYPDHIRRYKKRPIYWMFSSPKGTFNVLIYMHRYTPDTINLILNKYLRQLQEKMKHQLDHLNHVLDTGSAAEQNKATREKDRLRNLLLELQEYEREVIYPLATERIPIDLDDGVLVNYNKFGRALKEVAGLNDKKMKEKVRGFDWIDTGLIR